MSNPSTTFFSKTGGGVGASMELTPGLAFDLPEQILRLLKSHSEPLVQSACRELRTALNGSAAEETLGRLVTNLETDKLIMSMAMDMQSSGDNGALSVELLECVRLMLAHRPWLSRRVINSCSAELPHVTVPSIQNAVLDVLILVLSELDAIQEMPVNVAKHVLQTFQAYPLRPADTETLMTAIDCILSEFITKKNGMEVVTAAMDLYIVVSSMKGTRAVTQGEFLHTLSTLEFLLANKEHSNWEDRLTLLHFFMKSGSNITSVEIESRIVNVVENGPPFPQVQLMIIKELHKTATSASLPQDVICSTKIIQMLLQCIASKPELVEAALSVTLPFLKIQGKEFLRHGAIAALRQGLLTTQPAMLHKVLIAFQSEPGTKDALKVHVRADKETLQWLCENIHEGGMMHLARDIMLPHAGEEIIRYDVLDVLLKGVKLAEDRVDVATSIAILMLIGDIFESQEVTRLLKDKPILQDLLGKHTSSDYDVLSCMAYVASQLMASNTFPEVCLQSFQSVMAKVSAGSEPPLGKERHALVKLWYSRTYRAKQFEEENAKLKERLQTLEKEVMDGVTTAGKAANDVKVANARAEAFERQLEQTRKESSERIQTLEKELKALKAKHDDVEKQSQTVTKNVQDIDGKLKKVQKDSMVLLQQCEERCRSVIRDIEPWEAKSAKEFLAMNLSLIDGNAFQIENIRNDITYVFAQSLSNVESDEALARKYFEDHWEAIVSSVAQQMESAQIIRALRNAPRIVQVLGQGGASKGGSASKGTTRCVGVNAGRSLGCPGCCVHDISAPVDTITVDNVDVTSPKSTGDAATTQTSFRSNNSFGRPARMGAGVGGVVCGLCALRGIQCGGLHNIRSEMRPNTAIPTTTSSARGLLGKASTPTVLVAAPPGRSHQENDEGRSRSGSNHNSNVSMVHHVSRGRVSREKFFRK
eukprot:PhF_6_TR10029/c0_g1_i2/m.15368